MKSDFDVRKEIPGLIAAKIINKQHLYEYLTKDFSTLFFTKNLFVQEEMVVVGPVRMRTIHTNKASNCPLENNGLTTCYETDMMDPDNLYTKPINGVAWSTCEETGHSNIIQGELT